MIGKTYKFESYEFTAIETIKDIQGDKVIFESGNITSLSDLLSDHWTEIKEFKQ